jgi:hypothetical protein
VLRVTLPKREETKARRIEIKGGEAGQKTIDTKPAAPESEEKTRAAGGK